MQINSQFDGGNIECLDCASAQDIRLSIKNDNNCKTLQWFYFRLTGAQNQACHLRLVNAGDAAYLNGWNSYRALASYNRKDWFRVETHYKSGQLSINITPEQNCIYFAYFAPYPLERVASFIGELTQSPLVDISQLGTTLDGRSIDCLTIGQADTDIALKDKKVCWLIARQHPGETMASWWMEGCLRRLIDSSDPIARQLLQQAVFYVVPLMNPDGSFRGHLRTNAAGIDLNRQWQVSTPETSPEVYYVKEAMQRSGIDFFLDVHGDEALAYNFIAAAEGIPSWDTHLHNLTKNYKSALQQASPDFQTEQGYPITPPGKANLAIATNYIAETFTCLAMTLEMPFKDSNITPEPIAGWSPERCRKLGAANLDALYSVVRDL